MSAFSSGRCRVFNLSPAADVRSTADCLRKAGLRIGKDWTAQASLAGATGTESGPSFEIESHGIDSLTAPTAILDAGNSGTTMRLLSGLMAGRPFSCRFDGDASLRKRTMKRIFDPLRQMGATIISENEPYAPFSIEGGNLKGQEFQLTVASAQVEACLLLAGLQADGVTSVSTSGGVRDHTRRMFEHLKVPFSIDKNGSLSVSRLADPLNAFDLTVPADISSAAFFMVAAACAPGSELLLEATGINPGRTLVIDVLKSMGAHIEIGNERDVSGEPIADILVKNSGPLNGCTISGDVVASGIDELPVLALAGCVCEGEFSVSGASELRHKESDRITAIVSNLARAGVDVEEREDGFVIRGKRSIPGASDWLTHGDHRLAMTGLVASLIFEQPLKLDSKDSIAVSYPGFEEDLKTLLR
jgi:3-phosphoshikimate 1-carboxyvinyltransferase